MKKKFFGAVVAPISIVGLTFALGLGTTAFGVGEQRQSNPDSLEINALDVTTDIQVVAWCGWYVSGSASGPLTLEPDTVGAEYTGELIALTGIADSATAYVGPSAGLGTKGASDHCSWFTDANKYGASYTVSSSGSTFTAEAQLSPAAVEDPAMTFTTDSDSDRPANPLRITNLGIEACSGSGDSFTTDATAEIDSTNLLSTPWTVVTDNVENNNFCEWKAKYQINIPAGMSPTYGDVLYRWTGPTLTHTLVIPETV
jgi:hypothetical protein